MGSGASKSEAVANIHVLIIGGGYAGVQVIVRTIIIFVVILIIIIITITIIIIIYIMPREPILPLKP